MNDGVLLASFALILGLYIGFKVGIRYGKK